MAEEDNNVTIIGTTMVITGDVETTGPVVLSGTVDGAITGTTLSVAAGARLRGKIVADSIECAGFLEGNITTGHLHLKATAHHRGTVVTKGLEVEPGAILDCALQSGEASQKKSLPEGIAQQERRGRHDLGEYLGCFEEQNRPCCYEVPWSRRMALYQQLLDILEKKKPLIKIIGEQGSGKSSMVAKLLEDLPKDYKVVQINLHEGSVAEVLRSAAEALGVSEVKNCTSQQEIVSSIRNVLSQHVFSGIKILFLLDDAQQMYQATLEGVVRLLTGACDEEYSGELQKGRAQLILLGTDSLNDILVATINDYFEDETNCLFFLEPIIFKDTADYIRLGIQFASKGGSDAVLSIFPHETIKEIHTLSSGNIAKINDLVRSGIQVAHLNNEAVVTPQSLR